MALNDPLDEALAALIQRYEMLERHALSVPGRTPERRDSMREISARFPGALRELDCIGLDGVVERGAAVRQIFDLARRGDTRRLDDPDAAWIRYAIELLPRLREVLRIKSWLAHNAANALTSEARARLHAWYAETTGGGVLDDELIDRVAAPPGGQVQQIAYGDAARALGVGVDELKRALYPETEPVDDD
jgi:hypothetical protein